jgi:hypothetical protein
MAKKARKTRKATRPKTRTRKATPRPKATRRKAAPAAPIPDESKAILHDLYKTLRRMYSKKSPRR